MSLFFIVFKGNFRVFCNISIVSLLTPITTSDAMKISGYILLPMNLRQNVKKTYKFQIPNSSKRAIEMKKTNPNNISVVGIR